MKEALIIIDADTVQKTFLASLDGVFATIEW